MSMKRSVKRSIVAEWIASWPAWQRKVARALLAKAREVDS